MGRGRAGAGPGPLGAVAAAAAARARPDRAVSAEGARRGAGGCGECRGRRPIAARAGNGGGEGRGHHRARRWGPTAERRRGAEWRAGRGAERRRSESRPPARPRVLRLVLQNGPSGRGEARPLPATGAPRRAGPRGWPGWGRRSPSSLIWALRVLRGLTQGLASPAPHSPGQLGRLRGGGCHCTLTATAHEAGAAGRRGGGGPALERACSVSQSCRLTMPLRPPLSVGPTVQNTPPVEGGTQDHQPVAVRTQPPLVGA